MSKHKQTDSPIGDELTNQTTQADNIFALQNVTQLREAIDQAVYGQTDEQENTTSEAERAHTVEGLTTLGQLGILTETDLDEAKKGYL